MKQYAAFSNWFSGLVYHPKDPRELTRRKKFLLITNLIALFFISGVMVLSYALDYKSFAVYMSMLLACTLIQTVLLLTFRTWSKWYMYAIFSFYIALIFYIIYKLGGLANSAGLLMVAYFFLLTAQWMQDTKLLLVTGALYVCGVVFVGIAFPNLTADPNLVGWKNNLLFAINAGWIGLLLAVALYYTIVKSEDEAESRVEQLEELDLLKSKLYTNIAHEFRTPLTLIKGKAEELGEQFGGDTMRNAHSIVRNSNKILFLVNQMLNLSKIEEGRMALHYVKGDLVEFVRFITDSFQEYADSRKVNLHFQSQCPKLLMDVEGEKLEECISNLLSNAIKYTPAGGHVTVVLSLLSNPHDRVEISVRDIGIGIPEDQLDKIFIRFYRVEDENAPTQDGTGIGLTLVSEYLKLMNGSIRLNSRPGAGSEFVVELLVSHEAEEGELIPVKQHYTYKEEKEGPQLIERELGADHPQLLIIEDNKELLGYLTDLLVNDYDVYTAENGSQGIERAIKYIPDIILSDVMMPGKSGYELCKVLKSDFRTNHIPLVLLTARADTESRITGREQGADAYLTKPFDKRELKVCLKNLFVQREVLRQKFRSGLFNQKNPEKEQGLNEKFLDRVIASLEKNYRNDRYGISELHSDLGISRVQLHRKLVALTGLSASNFIRNFRLQKARSLLLETNENISDIAWLVGFSDANYFSKSFIQEYGLSASEWRESFI